MRWRQARLLRCWSAYPRRRRRCPRSGRLRDCLPRSDAWSCKTLNAADFQSLAMSSSLSPLSAANRIGSFDLAGVMLAAADQRGEFTPLGFAQFDVVAYVHPGLLANCEAQTNQAMNQLFGTCPRLPRSPTRQAQHPGLHLRLQPYLPPTARGSRHAAALPVSPPSVHQKARPLERAGLIRRTPGVARSIDILVEPRDLPVLR